MKGALRVACMVALLCALSACSGLFKSTARPEQTYYLRSPAAASAGAEGGAAPPPLGVSVRIGHPLAAPGLDSPHIMLVQADHRMNFFAGSRWAAPAPDLIEALLVQTLRASGLWTSVEDTASPFPSTTCCRSPCGASTPTTPKALRRPWFTWRSRASSGAWKGARWWRPSAPQAAHPPAPTACTRW